MKKVFALLVIAGTFSLVACGSEEKAPAEETATVEESTEAVAEEAEPAMETTQYAEHVCTDKCTEEACSFACGEEGHECSEACHADAEEGHEHAEGEEHTEEEAH